MKYPPFIPDKCLADHKSDFQPLYRSAKHLCLSALFIAPRNKNSLIFSHKTSSVFLEKRFGLLKSDRSACEPRRQKRELGISLSIIFINARFIEKKRIQDKKIPVFLK